jgi:ABC-type amino acid transport substrate-binding protein
MAAALYLSLWLLPLLISVLTPFKYRDVFRYSKEALLTAFITQNVFIILPMLIEASQRLFEDYRIRSDETDSLAEVIVPVTFNFPNTGKLLSLLFIPFVAWMIGHPMALVDYPVFFLSGLASYFAKAQLALPFLLDLQKLPQDLFQLYLPTGFVNGKFDTMVSAMNLLAFSVIGAAALTGHIRIKATRMFRFLGASLAVLLLVLMGTRVLLSQLIDTSYHQDEKVLSMHLMDESLPMRVYRTRDELDPAEIKPFHSGYDMVERITERGVLRAGYDPVRLPYTFFNDEGHLVGFDVELIQILASEMDVSLEFIPVSWATLKEQLNSDEVDLVGTMPLSTHMLMDLDLSDPYTSGLLSLVVRDHRRDSFSSPQRILEHDRLVIAYPGPIEYIKSAVQKLIPGNHIEWRQIDSFNEFFEQEEGTFDALMVEAEIGTAWTLLHPEYDAVIPEGSRLRMPAGFAVADGQHDFAAMLGRWLAAKKATGELHRAYEYWVLGAGVEKREPRWSIGKDVLGWWE